MKLIFNIFAEDRLLAEKIAAEQGINLGVVELHHFPDRACITR